LYEGQFIMALATTSAVWRSTGGDQTRTATAGSMVMAAQFFISNCAATANVTNSTGTEALISQLALLLLMFLLLKLAQAILT
jgi:hypothetical protein